jgi:hypothetical protein
MVMTNFKLTSTKLPPATPAVGFLFLHVQQYTVEKLKVMSPKYEDSFFMFSGYRAFFQKIDSLFAPWKTLVPLLKVVIYF